MTVCGILGLIIAGLADRARSSMRPGSDAGTGPILLMSVYEDVAVLVGTLLFVLVPLIGALLALFLFLITYRLQQRRKRKHKGLRILKG
jgi:phosphate/sulfate permease